jgi:hypothetical protein
MDGSPDDALVQKMRPKTPSREPVRGPPGREGEGLGEELPISVGLLSTRFLDGQFQWQGHRHCPFQLSVCFLNASFTVRRVGHRQVPPELLTDATHIIRYYCVRRFSCALRNGMNTPVLSALNMVVNGGHTRPEHITLALSAHLSAAAAAGGHRGGGGRWQRGIAALHAPRLVQCASGAGQHPQQVVPPLFSRRDDRDLDVPANGFDTIPDALEAIARGELVVVLDDEDRENEGDLIMAADRTTPEAMAFMVEHTSGVVCIGMQGTDLDRLRIPLMVSTSENEEAMYTAFTVTVDLRCGTTTGISAADRTATLRALADPGSTPEDFKRPGHIFPLRYREVGEVSHPAAPWAFHTVQ